MFKRKKNIKRKMNVVLLVNFLRIYFIIDAFLIYSLELVICYSARKGL